MVDPAHFIYVKTSIWVYIIFVKKEDIEENETLDITNWNMISLNFFCGNIKLFQNNEHIENYEKRRNKN